jgi:prevent-host-death family protein
MTQIVNIYEAKTKLSQLVADALAGKEVVIAKAGKPLVSLHPIKTDKLIRKPGALKGKIWMAPDFDTYIPEEFFTALE